MKRLKAGLARLLCVVLLLGITPVTLQAEGDGIPEGYTLEEVVVLSRHNIRAPLSTTGSALDTATPHTWTNWSSNASELSVKGGMLETTMGQYFRKWLEGEGLIPENYRPEGNAVRFYANAKQRTIATSQYFSSGFLPVANVRIETNQEYDKMDPVFDPSLTFVNEAYAEDAIQEMKAAEKDLSKEFEQLMDIVDYRESDAYKKGDLSDLKMGDSEYVLEVGKEPAVTGSLKTGTSLSDALVLQYYEVEDDREAAFGHELSEEDWKAVSSIKDNYCDILFGTPLIARNVAHPLLKVIDSELERKDRKFTFLCGHDSNIVSVLSALEAEEYELPGATEAGTPIGTKVVFEKWKGSDGKEYARVRLVYESTGQLRSAPLLSLDNPPQSVVLGFEGLERNEDGLYPMEALDARFHEAIEAYYTIMKTYGIKSAGIVDTADR